MQEAVVQEKPTTEGSAKAIYILYLVGIVFGITAIVGVIMAYINRGEAPDWLKTHYQFQIRTFWIGALYMLISLILMFVVVGYLVFLFWLVWLIVRCIKGLQLIGKKEAHPNPTGWLF